MDLFTPEIEAQLLDNGRRQSPLLGTENDIDFYPVVKLFTPDAALYVAAHGNRPWRS